MLLHRPATHPHVSKRGHAGPPRRDTVGVVRARRCGAGVCVGAYACVGQCFGRPPNPARPRGVASIARTLAANSHRTTTVSSQPPPPPPPHAARPRRSEKSTALKTWMLQEAPQKRGGQTCPRNHTQARAPTIRAAQLSCRQERCEPTKKSYGAHNRTHKHEL
jgi:hypothetical protein